ncbi:MAG: 5-(carboxyamino)imidazole ribonucleotide mutase [Deltaproteobacteria bacterium]|nr:5-(carboxyamino)imidazole ribonucleotide mutase [Deltaproteobacteria bacterium]
MSKTPKVAILMGSKSDMPVMEKAAAVLKEFEVPFDMRVLSAHRNPDEVAAFAKGAKDCGIRVIIGGAGMAAHLAGVLAAHTHLPVIGVPLNSGQGLGGIDALLAVVQMPKGVPVATVAVDGAVNAALLAIQILALSDENLEKKLIAYRKKQSGRTNHDR